MARLVRIPVAALSPDCDIELNAETSKYATRVRRLGPGARVVLFDARGRTEADAEIVDVGRRAIRCRVGALRRTSAPSALPVTLLQALGKADKPEKVIRAATSLGVRTIVFVETSRTVPRTLPKQAKRERWVQVALDAARQSGRGDTPEIVGPLGYEGAVSRTVAGEGRFCLDARASETFASALGGQPADAGLVVLIGPEGGLTEQELELAEARGFLRVRLGRFVLRTETAAAAALGAVAARY